MEASVRSRRGESGTVKWRLHTHFEVDRHVPSRIDVPPPTVAAITTNGPSSIKRWNRTGSL